MDSGAARGKLSVVIVTREGTAGQADGDGRPSVHFALGGDGPAVHLDKLLDDAQPQPQPALVEAEVARGVVAGIELGEERLEQVGQRPGLEADPPVGDPDLGLVGGRSAARPRRSRRRRG